MELDLNLVVGFSVALGIGLLIGVEREKSRQTDASAIAGARTFTLVALLGAVARALGSEWIVVASILGVALIAVTNYRANAAEHPGITTDVALLVTGLLGAFALDNARAAGALGVTVAVLLVSRSWLHDWILHKLTAQEISDALLLLAAALVVLPLLPDRALGPWGTLNPRTIWTVIVVFMSVNSAGYIALRAFDHKLGLPLAGFLSGFVSSVATHGAMGQRARNEPQMARAAVAGAALSSVATVVQLALLLAVTSQPLLSALAVSLALAGAAAVAYGAVFTVRALRGAATAELPAGRAFQPRTVVLFALGLSAIVVVTAALNHWLGARGGVLGAAFAGFGDTHSAAVACATQAAAGLLDLDTARFALLLAFSTNSITKIALAYWSGGWRFAVLILPGLVLMVALAWLGVGLQHLL
jgi:uncharacterized membrane protein (DUF4010 family)